MKNEENKRVEENKRDELILIGLRIFTENGLSNFSVRKLVEEAGISIGLFYYYFNSKEGFILECVETYNQRFIDNIEAVLVNQNLSVIDRVHTALAKYSIQFNETFRIDEERLVTKANRLMTEDFLIRKSQPLIQNLIEEGIKSGDFQPCNSTVTSHFLASGLVGILIKMNLTEEKNIKEEVLRLTYAALPFKKI